MADFDSVATVSTMVRFKPASHARLARWAKAAKMKRSDFIIHLMNEATRQYKKNGPAPDWLIECEGPANG